MCFKITQTRAFRVSHSSRSNEADFKGFANMSAHATPLFVFLALDELSEAERVTNFAKRLF